MIPNNKTKECCEKCYNRNHDDERYCDTNSCSYHLPPKEECNHEIENNMTIAHCRKCKIILPPKEYNYERDNSHTHCWQNVPKLSPCGQPIENHKQYYLCDTPSPIEKDQIQYEEDIKANVDMNGCDCSQTERQICDICQNVRYGTSLDVESESWEERFESFPVRYRPIQVNEDYSMRDETPDIIEMVDRNPIMNFIKAELSTQKQKIVEMIQGMIIPCIGNPEMMQSLEDRFYNKALYDIINKLNGK